MARYSASLVAKDVDRFQEGPVYLNPIATPPRSRVGRMAWSLLRHPVKSREFPAKRERLVTPADLMSYGF